MSNTERFYQVSESELEQIFQFVIKKPINEAIEVYSLIMQISKRGEAPVQTPKVEPVLEKAEDIEEIEKAKTNK